MSVQQHVGQRHSLDLELQLLQKTIALDRQRLLSVLRELLLSNVLQNRAAKLTIFCLQEIGADADWNFRAVLAPKGGLEGQRSALLQFRPCRGPFFARDAAIDVGDRERQQLFARISRQTTRRVVHVEKLPIGIRPQDGRGDMVDGELGELEPLLRSLEVGNVVSDSAHAVDPACLISNGKTAVPNPTN